VFLRLIVAAAIASLAMTVGIAKASETVEPGYYADQKVVYHNDGGPDGPAYFKRLLGSLRNHVEALGKDHVAIRVVDHGDGVTLFKLAQTDKALAERIDALKADGVRFLICANTLKEREIDWRTLYGVAEQDIVPSGVAEIARLQQMGFVYVHL
jgi:intracellular sulfur oxidation DsrE/DsrF family protein